MNQEVYTAIADRLKDEVSALRWIDMDTGQLDVQAERPAVAFPACLIDVNYPVCVDLGQTIQNVDCQVVLRVAFNFTGQTSHVAPGRTDALNSMFSVLAAIHAALQGWGSEALTNFSRVSATAEKRRDGLKVYRLVYNTGFTERP